MMAENEGVVDVDNVLPKITYTNAYATGSIRPAAWRGKQLEGAPVDFIFMKGVDFFLLTRNGRGYSSQRAGQQRCRPAPYLAR